MTTWTEELRKASFNKYNWLMKHCPHMTCAKCEYYDNRQCTRDGYPGQIYTKGVLEILRGLRKLKQRPTV